MSSKSSTKIGREFFISASASLCLPLVQMNPSGILSLRHNNPFVYSFRVFRFGALIGSKTSSEFLTIFDLPDLRFSEIPRGLKFDVVVSGFISPKVCFLVFPIYLNASFVRIGKSFVMRLPGCKLVNWRTKLAAGISLITLRERHLYGRKTVWMSRDNSFSGGDYG